MDAFGTPEQRAPLRQTIEERMKEFTGKVAVVTGAASGIGLALAERFAHESMKVVLADIETAPLEAALASIRARAEPQSPCART
jgi:NAD(P)-dependent dehydrogenase (short-subunit alcohol dehydrogenase family)